MNFKAFEEELPDIYILADQADRVIGEDYVIALEHLKEIARLLVRKILINERAEIDSTDSLLNLEAILNIEILPNYLEYMLKQLEYADSRESALFIDASQIEKLMMNIHDFMSWYMKTYVNDQFNSGPLVLKPQTTMVNSLSDREDQTKETKSILHIDNKITEGNWIDKEEEAFYIELDADETYKGQFRNGMKSGKGVYRWSDGTKYEGQWYKDREHGFGIKEYANGDRYRGEWRDGLFEGKGVYEWNDGTTFEGNWQDNLQHGYGVKTNSDGTTQRGFWTLGEFVFTESNELSASAKTRYDSCIRSCAEE
ncbi:MORN repeat-containing protein [Paenibacillus hodogayensis]|uniref:MORN repeat-containing protein n=1 Tax=Paenibacillus hodogayensis TaxID=279208 RepID=A0ABV5VPE3_9BACL